MPTWIWILIAVAAVVILALLILPALRKSRERRLEKKRGEARELRQEAEQRLSRAGEQEALGQQQIERARRERSAAENAVVHAEDVDPDAPDDPDRSPTGDGPGARRLPDH
jgi:Sec-independent protein translocase protein TatA